VGDEEKLNCFSLYGQETERIISQVILINGKEGN